MFFDENFMKYHNDLKRILLTEQCEIFHIRIKDSEDFI